jgi:hypothetical protein
VSYPSLMTITMLREPSVALYRSSRSGCRRQTRRPSATASSWRPDLARAEHRRYARAGMLPQQCCGNTPRRHSRLSSSRDTADIWKIAVRRQMSRGFGAGAAMDMEQAVLLSETRAAAA